MSKFCSFRLYIFNFLGFSEHYKCPHILLSTVGATTWVTTVTGNPNPYSYIPHDLLDLTDKMNFLERLQNTLYNLIEDGLMHLFYYDLQKEIYDNAFPDSQTFRPFWDKMKHGVSLVSLLYPRLHRVNSKLILILLGSSEQSLLAELSAALSS